MKAERGMNRSRAGEQRLTSSKFRSSAAAIVADCPLLTTILPSAHLARAQVREWIQATGVDNIGKRLVNSREGRVEFDKPPMPLSTLMNYGEATAAPLLAQSTLVCWDRPAWPRFFGCQSTSRPSRRTPLRPTPTFVRQPAG